MNECKRISLQFETQSHKMKQFLSLSLLGLTALVVCVGCRTTDLTPASTGRPAPVRIAPYPHNPPDQNQYLAFKAIADWLDGYLMVRFPENINSSLGLHFLDNLEPHLPRVSQVRLPDWQTDPATGALFYEVQTREGIDFGGRVQVTGEVVHMTFSVTNRTGKTQNINSQVCLDLSRAQDLNERITLDHTFAWMNGQYRSLANTTSERAAEKFATLNYNWVLLLYNEQPNDPMRRIENECPWWIVDQKPDHPLLVRETADRKHLIAISWGKSSVRRLMTNSNIPCLHTDPLECANLPDGQSFTWHGRIFMLENDPATLLRLYQSGN